MAAPEVDGPGELVAEISVLCPSQRRDPQEHPEQYALRLVSSIDVLHMVAVLKRLLLSPGDEAPEVINAQVPPEAGVV